MNEMKTTEPYFNLLDEPWIKVLTEDLSEKEVSLKTLFENAHHYLALSGETATQNAAVLRFLLAILITVFYRYDENGDRMEIDEEDDPDDVIDRWQTVWDRGQFQMDAINDYLETWRDRFWLFHPQRPFMQLTTLTEKTASRYSSNMLIGDMKTSNNTATKHHFALREGDALSVCSFSQAARGLIFLNAYSVNVKKPAKKECGGNPSQVGRLGQLGLLMANGNNLFETLMLNATPLKEGSEIWPGPRPIWERDKVDERRGVIIGAIDNLPALYTIPRRKMLLESNENSIGSILVAGGEYEEDPAFTEQMTLWQERKDSKTKITEVVPKRHQSDVQMWREFSSIFGIGLTDDVHQVKKPGLIHWIETLRREGIISSGRLFRIQAVGMIYDGMKYAFVDEIDDRIALSMQLLNQNSDIWRQNITEQIEKCEKVGILLNGLGKKLSKYVYGDKGTDDISPVLRQQYYYAIDAPFREWLASIRPETDSREAKLKEWEKISFREAKGTVQKYVENTGINLFVTKKRKKGNKDEMIAVPKEINLFFQKLNNIY